MKSIYLSLRWFDRAHIHDCLETPVLVVVGAVLWVEHGIHAVMEAGEFGGYIVH